MAEAEASMDIDLQVGTVRPEVQHTCPTLNYRVLPPEICLMKIQGHEQKDIEFPRKVKLGRASIIQDHIWFPNLEDGKIFMCSLEGNWQKEVTRFARILPQTVVETRNGILIVIGEVKVERKDGKEELVRGFAECSLSKTATPYEMFFWDHFICDIADNKEKIFLLCQHENFVHVCSRNPATGKLKYITQYHIPQIAPCPNNTMLVTGNLLLICSYVNSMMTVLDANTGTVLTDIKITFPWPLLCAIDCCGHILVASPTEGKLYSRHWCGNDEKGEVADWVDVTPGEDKHLPDVRDAVFDRTNRMWVTRQNDLSCVNTFKFSMT